jgi:ATP-dependent Clp protease adaptor protein ClpS
VRPEISDGTGHGELWVVVVFNNDHNTWDQVVDILMRATACTQREAEIETWEIDRLGKSVVHHGDEDECMSVAEVIREIGIRVEVATE